MITVGFGLRNFSLLTGVSRATAELVRRLPAHGFRPVVAAHRLPAEQGPIDLKRVPLLPLTSLTRAASFDFLARRALRRSGAALIHGQGDLTVQDVLSVHNCDAAAAHYVADGRRPSAGVAYVRKRQFARGGAKVIVVHSHMVKRDLERFYGIDANMVVHVPLGVDLERFHPGRRPAARRELLRTARWPAETRVVLSVLSGDPAKRNFSLLLRAVEALGPKAAAALCVVGNVDGAAYRREASARRLRERGLLHHVPATLNVQDYFAAADVFLLPARYEEFGLTVLEALASGCPAVVSGRTGAAEIIEAGSTGEIVDDMSRPDLWAAALDRVLEGKSRREACRQSAERFTWDRYAENMAGIYRRILC